MMELTDQLRRHAFVDEEGTFARSDQLHDEIHRRITNKRIIRRQVADSLTGYARRQEYRSSSIPGERVRMVERQTQGIASPGNLDEARCRVVPDPPGIVGECPFEPRHSPLIHPAPNCGRGLCSNLPLIITQELE